VAWLLLVYVVLAALHGAAPQLWLRHNAEGQTDGPFRVLIFTLIIAVVAVAFQICRTHLRVFHPPLVSCPATRTTWSPRSLRGPPLHR